MSRREDGAARVGVGQARERRLGGEIVRPGQFPVPREDDLAERPVLYLAERCRHPAPPRLPGLLVGLDNGRLPVPGRRARFDPVQPVEQRLRHRADVRALLDEGADGEVLPPVVPPEE